MGLSCLAHLIFRIVNKRIFKIEIVSRFSKLLATSIGVAWGTFRAII